jgi:NAD(P)-dependent dehydrogenase (short-subunit alcohol dehydrogenase family)
MTAEWTDADIPDLAGKVAIVTGANRRIGYTTARALAGRGATVILACRDREKGEAAVQQISQAYPEAKASAGQLDLVDLASVRRFADKFNRQQIRLDMLINNAGIMRTPFGRTADGFELQLATNHLGHFALTGLLLGQLIGTPKARVVTVTSWGHHFGKIDFDNLNAEMGYDAGRAYAQSKLANVLFTYELQRRFERAGVDAIAVVVHPGATKTDLPVHWPMVRILTPLIGQAPEMGALPTLYAATAPDVQGGDYYGPRDWGGLRGSPKKLHSSRGSYDTEVAAKLWAVSEALTGVRYQWPVVGESGAG